MELPRRLKLHKSTMLGDQNPVTYLPSCGGFSIRFSKKKEDCYGFSSKARHSQKVRKAREPGKKS
jgi:hypothetical protein